MRARAEAGGCDTNTLREEGEGGVKYQHVAGIFLHAGAVLIRNTHLGRQKHEIREAVILILSDNRLHLIIAVTHTSIS